MSVSVYQASVPVFTQFLEALSATMAKASAHAVAKKIDPQAYCQARLFPDMFPFARQVQLTADFAKNTTSRLAGLDPPKFADDEKTFEELQGRIARTLTHIKSIPAAQIDAASERTVTIPMRGNTMTFTGNNYLMHFALPNFFFHASTAYAILRENGVELGKGDFIGQVPV